MEQGKGLHGVVGAGAGAGAGQGLVGQVVVGQGLVGQGVGAGTGHTGTGHTHLSCGFGRNGKAAPDKASPREQMWQCLH